MQSEENKDWKNLNRPDIEEKPEYGILLKEFSSGSRHPSVYLIWERQIGNPIEKIGIVCICSTREIAELRVRGMNSSTFWGKGDIERPITYMIEECEIDHLCAAEMMGYDLNEDQINASMTRSEINWFMDQGKFERLREAAAERISELKDALRNLLDAHDALCKDVNWQKSFLKAETVQKINDAPGIARMLLGGKK